MSRRSVIHWLDSREERKEIFLKGYNDAKRSKDPESYDKHRNPYPMTTWRSKCYNDGYKRFIQEKNQK